MKSRMLVRMAACVALACVLLPLLSACGNQEEKAPAGYYEGPRAPKKALDDTGANTGTTGTTSTGTNP